MARSVWLALTAGVVNEVAAAAWSRALINSNAIQGVAGVGQSALDVLIILRRPAFQLPVRVTPALLELPAAVLWSVLILDGVHAPVNVARIALGRRAAAFRRLEDSA
jgi:hypothetical protein